MKVIIEMKMQWNTNNGIIRFIIGCKNGKFCMTTQIYTHKNALPKRVTRSSQYELMKTKYFISA